MSLYKFYKSLVLIGFVAGERGIVCRTIYLFGRVIGYDSIRSTSFLGVLLVDGL
jgi:hypothetical protein